MKIYYIGYLMEKKNNMTLLEIYKEILTDKTLLGKIFIGIPIIIVITLFLPIVFVVVVLTVGICKINFPSFIKIKRLFYK